MIPDFVFGAGFGASALGLAYSLYRISQIGKKAGATPSPEPQYGGAIAQPANFGQSVGNFAETIPASYIITVIDTVDGQLIGLSMPDNRKNAGHSFPSNAPTVIRGFLNNDERTKLGEKINELVVRAKLEANV